MSERPTGNEADTGTQHVYASCPECPHDERLEIDREMLVITVTCSACGHEFLASHEQGAG